MSQLNYTNSQISGNCCLTLKQSPVCKQNSYGNYCSECGAKLVELQEVTCPCCHGTGKVSPDWRNTYWWQTACINNHWQQPIHINGQPIIKY